MQTFVIILKITKDGSYISLRIRGWVHSGICFCFNCLACLLVSVWWCIITVNVVIAWYWLNCMIFYVIALHCMIISHYNSDIDTTVVIMCDVTLLLDRVKTHTIV